jgi:hypothetical protein
MQIEGLAWLALSYLGTPSFEARLTELGFAPRNRWRSLLAYVDADWAPELSEEIFDCRNAFVFGGETDLF